MAAPATFDAGRWQAVRHGIVTGFALSRTLRAGDDKAQATLEQRADHSKSGRKAPVHYPGWRLHHATLSVICYAQNTVKQFYGPVPVAYLKLAVGKTTQFLIGSAYAEWRFIITNRTHSI